MKRKIFFVCVSIFTTVFILQSCQEDLLDKKPLDKISSEDVWTDRGLINAYMVDLYARIAPYISWNLSWNSNIDYNWSDNIALMLSNNVKEEALSSSNDMGFNQYANIRRVNIAIDELTGNSGSLDETFVTQTLAEAKTFRAMIYFWMVRRFGGVMKVDKVLQVDDEMMLPRSTEKEIYDFIIDDLTYAKNNLPDDKQLGKLNKATAHGFLIRVLTDARRYDDVIVECREFLETESSYGYSIDPDYNGIFNLYSTGIASPENIFIRYGDESGLYTGITPLQYLLPLSNKERTKPTCDWSNIKTSMYGWAYIFPSQQIVDAYEVVDDDGVAKNWWETNRWKNRTSGPNSTEVMWKNRDKRFYASIVYDGCIFQEDLYQIRYPYFPYRRMMATNQHYAMSGYLVRKGTQDDLGSWSSYGTPVNYHWPVLRLSEIYLNYSEALIRKDRKTEALPYINEIRVKHGGLPPITEVNNLLEKYKRERRVEMFAEADRYWSLIRWGKEENLDVIPELNENTRYIDISPDGSEYYIATMQGQFFSDYGPDYAGNIGYFESLPSADRLMVPGQLNANNKFSSKRYLFPIPKWHMDRNPNLKQNPGW